MLLFGHEIVGCGEVVWGVVGRGSRSLILMLLLVLNWAVITIYHHSCNLVLILVSWERLASAIAYTDWATFWWGSIGMGHVYVVLVAFIYFFQMFWLITCIILVSHGNSADLLMALYKWLQPLLIPHNITSGIKFGWMCAGRTIYIDPALPNVTRGIVSVIEAYPSWRLSIFPGVAATFGASLAWLWMYHPVTRTVFHRDALQTTLTFVLLDHQIYGFLSVVKVELVIVGLLVFILFLPIVVLIVIATTSSPVPSILEQKRSTLRSLRLG